MSHEIEQRPLEQIFGSSEAHQNLLVLSDDIGSRLAGSENEIRARDFLVDALSRYGLNDVHVEEFQHRAWTPVKEQLTVTAPVEREIACRCGGLSPSTPDGGIQARVVFLERGDREEFEARRADVAGRFVAAPYYPIARQMKTPLAAEYGAAGLIEWRTYPGGLQPARTCAFARVASIPVASISKEDAAYLMRLERRRGRVRIRLTLDSRVEVKPSWNVVGDLGGDRGEAEYLVVGGHYDSWHVGPGAIDNAAGVVAVLEAARGLAGYQQHLRRRVRFVLFGVEESGLVGSWSYTRDHEDELDDLILMINNDVGGRPSGIHIAGYDDWQPALTPVAKRVRVDGDGLPPFEASVGGPGWGSDHFPFLAHGVHTVGIGTTPVDPLDGLWGHTRADTPDKVYVQGLTECAAINAQVILHASNLPERPAIRKTSDEVEAMFRSYGFIETLDLLDVWPPEHAKKRYFTFE